MQAGQSADGDSRRVSVTERFVLAAVCCGVFAISVVVLARMTADAAVKPLREWALVLLLVCVNYALCLGAVMYVSRRLRSGASKAGVR
jgi:hypothetical protein